MWHIAKCGGLLLWSPVLISGLGEPLFAFLPLLGTLAFRKFHPAWIRIAAYLVRDNDGAYGHVFTSRVRAMGIRDRPISSGSPWQNGYAERLIGTVRRECLDRMLIFGESHLGRIPSAYAAYYNQTRAHLALPKDAPLHRAVQRSGVIVAIPILAGLYHQYVRI